MKSKQLKLNFWGGYRANAGRKRVKSKGVAHRTRQKVNRHAPMHINFKYKAFIKTKSCLKLLKHSINNARKHGLRINQFSLQSSHIHLIVEADNNEILTRGMRSLTNTFAKGLDKGRVQLERYHLHVLKSRQETKNAIHYVLFNQQKHEKGTCSKIDGYTSVLSLPNALELVRNFAKKNRMTLKIVKEEIWKPDPGKGYLLNMALT